jgi:glutamyl-tRNA synthetase
MFDSLPARVRMAPSPTGSFHLGSARTALFNWLYARHTGGQFLLRIEDTDQTRYVPGALEDIVESLRWLGLQWDEGPEVGGPEEPYFQSQRLPLYQAWAEWLVQNGHAYRCYCSAQRLDALRKAQEAHKQPLGYDRHCRNLSSEERAAQEASGVVPVIRFAMPLTGEVTFVDLIRGPITFDNSKIIDPVLLKSDGYPTYHLANVVDDHFMQITHILRGDEWLSSVPLHVHLYEAFGWDMPVLAHLPLILDPSGHGKLSKRKKKGEGDEELLTYVKEYREAGYLPEAMFNFLANLGWAYSADTDLFTPEQAVAKFELSDIHPAPGALPLSKLEWMNGHYIRTLSVPDLTERLLPFLAEDLGIPAAELRDHPALPVLVPLIQERLKTLADAGELIDFAFVDEITYDPQALVAKGLDAARSLTALEVAHARLAELPFNAEELEAPLRALADELDLKPGQLFGMLRVAITGKAVAPPIFGSIVAVGREKALARCTRAEELLRGLIAG